MKKSAFILLSLLFTVTLLAKKVKFEVDMTDQTISTYGVHVAGDFQDLAGYSGGDWQPGTTEMVNETGTNIYSVIVDIPAFAKYEYKFLNGDQWYDVEFVPWESRVGYNFNDNRWIFVDSISNDTTTTQPILYAGNAPSGLKLLRFKVDLQKESSVSPAGVHVAGDFQGWDPTIFRLYDFDTTIFEYMAYVGQGPYEYKYYNGNTTGSAESIPEECAVNGNRWVNIVNDTMVEVVCFAECSACIITQLPGYILEEYLTVFPNPASDKVFVEFNDDSALHNITVTNNEGEMVLQFRNYGNRRLVIETMNLKKGIYFIQSETSQNTSYTAKLIIE
jgi:hypothetical protein